MSRIFRERPDFIFNDIMEVKKAVLEGRIKSRDLKSMIKNRERRIRELKEQIEMLKKFEDLIPRIDVK